MIALVVGGTGLVGRQLVQQLLADARFTRVITLGRREVAGLEVTGLPAGPSASAKLEQRVVDLGKPETYADGVRGDVAFSCLGTTKKAAGSVAAQRVVDVDYPLAFARAAAKNGVASFALVSSAGADATSTFAYPRMKGELDEAVRALPFARVRIVRPSVLEGQRAEERLGERVGIAVGKALASIGIARSYRPIPVATVARALVASCFDGPEARRIYTLGEVLSLAETAAG